MKIYDEGRICADFEKEMPNWEELYDSPVVKRIGVTSDSQRLYTEIVAQKILDHIADLEMLNSINVVTRDKSYKVKHPHIPFDPDPSLGRKEEGMARSFRGSSFGELGEIIDYQTPLYKERKKGDNSRRLGKIDLLSYNKNSNAMYCIEYKWIDSHETLLRCVLEIYTYWRTVCRDKLSSDFGHSAAEIRKAVLVYKSCQAYTDFKQKDTAVRELMRKLGVDFFALDCQSSNVIESHLHESL